MDKTNKFKNKITNFGANRWENRTRHNTFQNKTLGHRKRTTEFQKTIEQHNAQHISSEQNSGIRNTPPGNIGRYRTNLNNDAIELHEGNVKYEREINPRRDGSRTNSSFGMPNNAINNNNITILLLNIS